MQTQVDDRLALCGLRGSHGLRLDLLRGSSAARLAGLALMETRDSGCEVPYGREDRHVPQETGTGGGITLDAAPYTACESCAAQPASAEVLSAFAAMSSLHTLDTSYCLQPAIMDGAFLQSSCLHTLNMSYCNLSTITDGAFAHLSGLHSLDMSQCRQSTVTHEAFSHLPRLHTLIAHGFGHPADTNAAFAISRRSLTGPSRI